MPDLEQALETLLGQAEAFAAQGKWDQAQAAYKQVLELSPAHPAARRSLTQLCLKRSDYQAAVREFLEWGQACQANGLVDDAIRVYQEILTLEQTQEKRAFTMDRRAAMEAARQIRELVGVAAVDVFYNLGILYADKGNLDDAIGCLRRSLDIAPLNATYHLALGRVFMKKDQYKEAQGEFQEVIRLSPNEAALAYEMLGEIFVKSGKPPQSTVVWYRNAADRYLKAGQPGDAIRVLTRILDFDPKNKDILTLLGEVYAQHGQMDQAVTTYQHLAQVYGEEGVLDKVLALHEKLLDWDPDNAPIRERVIDIYRKILSQDPSNMSARVKLIGNLLRTGGAEEAVPEYLLLADTYLVKGMLDEAQTVGRKLLELDHQNVQAHVMVGEVLFRQGNTDASMQEFFAALRIFKDHGDELRAREVNQKLSTLFPNQAEVHYHMAVFFLDQGLPDEAAAELQATLQAAPDHVPALSRLSEIYASRNMHEDTIALYQQILGLDPGNAEIREQLIVRLLAAGSLHDALAQTLALADQLTAAEDQAGQERLYRRILTYFPDDVEVRRRLAQLALARRETARAREELLFLTVLALGRGMVAQALAASKQLLEAAPEDLNARGQAARLAARQGLTQDAVRQLTALAGVFVSRQLAAPAAAALADVVALSPGDTAARRRLVELLLGDRRLPEAVQQLKNLVRIALREKDPASARQAAIQTVSLDPANLGLREDFAALFEEEGAPDLAATLVEELAQDALRRGDLGRAKELLMHLAALCRPMGQMDRAAAAEMRSAEMDLDAGHTEAGLAALGALAEDFARRGQFAHAQTVLDRMVGLYRDQGRPADYISRLQQSSSALLDAGNTEAALFLDEQIMVAHESMGSTGQALALLTALARRYRDAGLLDKAAGSHGRAAAMLEQQHRNAEAVDQLLEELMLHLTRRSLPDAARVFEGLDARGKADEALICRVADLYMSANLAEGARPLYERVLAAEPDHPDALARLAAIHAVAGDLESAASYARRVLCRSEWPRVLDDYLRLAGLAPGDPATHIALGRLYRAAGLLEDAIAELEQAGRDDRSALTAANLIGECFLDQGLADLAQKQFQRALDRPGHGDDEYQDVRYNLGRLYQDEGRVRDALALYQECYAVDIKYRDAASRIEELTSMLSGEGNGSETGGGRRG